MILPVLEKPLLLTSSLAASVTSIDTLQTYLEGHFKFLDLEPIKPKLASKPTVNLQMAVAAFGDIGLVSVQGSPLAMSIKPVNSHCMLALPSSGWGHYQMDDHQVDNTAGQSVAFIPAKGWRLVNDATGGTLVQFQEQALLRRMQAIAPELKLVDAAVLLKSPFAIQIDNERAQQHYRMLLGALQMVDMSYCYGGTDPDPMLRLDDLILRCVALLINPLLADQDEHFSSKISQRDLHKTILNLMEWMKANLHTPISLSEIEQQAGYGRRAIQQGFKAEVGCGPMQWLRKQRLYLAYDKIKAADLALTVGQVATSCGYLNLASFSRDFRECFDVSASTMLRNVRRGQTP